MPVILRTAEDLRDTRIPDKRTELVNGVLRVREPTGDRHGRVTLNLTLVLGDFVRGTHAGQLFAAETGFILSRDPDSVRAADIAFVRRDRLPAAGPGFLEVAPDLVVEVLSPGDRPGEILAKVGDWLEAGARLVWVIDPERRCARIYRADGSETSLTENGELGGEELLPGFTCPLAAVF